MPPAEPPAAPPRHDAYAVIRVPSFRLYLSGNVLSVLGMQMQLAAVEWEIYQRTGSKFAIGLIGLVQFAPVIVLVLLAGHVVDTFNRKRIVICSTLVIAAASCGLAWISATQADHRLMYGCVFLIGMARAFHQPAKAALLPQLVPLNLFSNAVAWNTGGFHLASVVGPGVGGLLIAARGSPAIVYQLNAAFAVSFCVCLLFIQTRQLLVRRAMTFQDVTAGLAYLRRNQVVLGAILLDMFAVLLGGAVALLPVYATDILKVGAAGFGWMRAAPAVGALSMALVLAHRPPMARAGRTLLWSVAGFGVATIVFGFSRNFWLSFTMLLLTGALDNISVVIRHTLVQVLTPDNLRGRVSAINGLFIGASNELGAFESGTVAQLFSPTISVVSGGLGTLLVVLVAALAWPRLRRYGSLGSADEPNSSS
jgi:MFS family permease